MTRTVFYTATTLDGFLADEDDSLAWLFVQDPGDRTGYDEFLAGVGAMVMGSTTYEWLVAHLAETGTGWPYDLPCFVFTHRDLPSLHEQLRFVAGTPDEHWDRITEATGDRDIWLVGGGDLAAQFADAGHLDQLRVSIAPVTLGSGRPLFPRRYALKLTHLERSGDFAIAWYDVQGPGDWPSTQPSEPLGAAD